MFRVVEEPLGCPALLFARSKDKRSMLMVQVNRTVMVICVGDAGSLMHSLSSVIGGLLDHLTIHGM